MQRYFISDNQFYNDKVHITGEDARHITKVMRMKPGTEIICCNLSGEAFRCKISSIDEVSVAAEVISMIENSSELPVDIAIVQGLPKGDKLDLIVQKGTELGAQSFIIFQAERSIVKWSNDAKSERKRDRLQKIAKEAAEQSHRNIIPAVSEPLSLQRLIEKSHHFHHKIVAYEEEAKVGEWAGLPSVFKKMQTGQSLMVVIGPEGGLSEQEISALEAAGFIKCALGKRILRTETAPMYLLSAVSYYFELEKEVN